MIYIYSIYIPSTVRLMLCSPVKVSSVMEISTSYAPSSDSCRLWSSSEPLSNTWMRFLYSGLRFPITPVPTDCMMVTGFTLSLFSCHLMTGLAELLLLQLTDRRASRPTVPLTTWVWLVTFTPKTSPADRSKRQTGSHDRCRNCSFKSKPKQKADNVFDQTEIRKLCVDTFKL